MFRTILMAALVGLSIPAIVVANSGEPNLCSTTHAGQCVTPLDWEIGWFWANHPVSVSSCDLFQQRFGSDVWNMCDEIYQAAADAMYDEATAQRTFTLTSKWHRWGGEGSNPCPYEGLDPIIDYENNTFVCATSF